MLLQRRNKKTKKKQYFLALYVSPCSSFIEKHYCDHRFVSQILNLECFRIRLLRLIVYFSGFIFKKKIANCVIVFYYLFNLYLMKSVSLRSKISFPKAALTKAGSANEGKKTHSFRCQAKVSSHSGKNRNSLKSVRCQGTSATTDIAFPTLILTKFASAVCFFFIAWSLSRRG